MIQGDTALRTNGRRNGARRNGSKVSSATLTDIHEMLRQTMETHFDGSPSSVAGNLGFRWTFPSGKRIRIRAVKDSAARAVRD